MRVVEWVVAATPAPAPGIGDTVSLAAPWQWTLPLLITCLLGAATAVGVVWTIVQKHRSDQRQQLWNRMQWALNSMTSSNPEARAVGAMAVARLAASNHLPKGEGPPAKLTTYDVELLDQALEALD